MSWDLVVADDYIQLNTLDNEDWFDSEDTRKLALLNVSKRVLTSKFTEIEEMPDEAIYMFATTLSAIFNDTMKQAQRGVASFSIKGISFSFKDWAKKDLSEFIPEEVYSILGIPKRQIKWTVL